MSDKAFIPVARPTLGDEEAEAVARVLRTGWITQGPEVERLEGEFAAYVGATHAVAVSSGTAALHLALLAIGVQPGDDIVTVSHSFIATANAVRYCGARPVFVDIDPASFNLDPALLEAAITPRTRAVVAVHQMGVPCDLAAILAIARRRGLIVVEDAACAVGSEIDWAGEWQRIGRPHGDIACFSFHPRKLLTTGDGGMVTTARADWAEALRLLRWHGMSVPAHVRHVSRRVVNESYVELGWNYRLTDLQAAVGRVQLARLPDALARRRALAQRYARLLRDVPGVDPPIEPGWARSNWQSYCVRLAACVDQGEAMQALLERGIATRRGVMCAHREPAYRGEDWSCGAEGCACAPGACARLAHSEAAQDRSIVLPLYPDMAESEQDAVVAALREIARAADERIGSTGPATSRREGRRRA
jgi:dTDP-4-amino-4,6-dideoxygalactose transaminase